MCNQNCQIYLPRKKEQKKNINKWDYIKLKIFAQQKKSSTKLKDNKEWENIIADTSDKGVMSKICKELTKLNTHTHTENKTN